MSTTNHNGASRDALADRHKEAVKGWVPRVRRLLEEEYEAQLDRLGLKRSGKPIPIEEMRLPDEADRRLVGKSAALNEDQLSEIAKLPKGTAVIYQNDWLEPVLCKIDKFKGKEIPYHYSAREEVYECSDDKWLKRELLKPDFLMV